MTTHLPMPSSQVARKAAGPKMRFLYPLAAACIATVFLAPSTGEAQTSARLRPDQVQAIEIALKEVEPSMRPMAREQLAKTFANFSEPQIAMMMAKMNENKAAAAKAPKPVVEIERKATPEDLAFNRAQYEPVIRRHHATQKRFDAFVNAKVTAYCPGRDEFARFGSGWRYEQGQFMEPSALATWNVETNVEVANQAYAPKDGRYQFDCSKVRMTFEEKAIDGAIKAACDSIKIRGREFLAKVDPLIAKGDWNDAFKAESMAQAQLDPIRRDLQATFARISPGDFTEIQLALMNGKRLKA